MSAAAATMLTAAFAPRIARMSDPSGFLPALRRRVPHIFVLAFTLTAMDFLRAFPLLLETQGAGYVMGAVSSIAVQNIVGCALVIAAITFAERTAFAMTHRALALVLAVVVAAPVATAVGAAPSITGENAGWIKIASTDWAALYLYLLWYNLVVGLLAAAYFTIWERAHRSAIQLRAAEIERQGIEQRTVESRLNVMKARVDPEFLFRMIGDVQRLYRGDTDAAEQRLEDLIEYLRAALPQMRGGATTLGEEVRLATAYLRLHEDGFEGRLQAAFDVDPSLDDAQFPPMALLPLVDDALQRAAGLPRPRLALRVAAGDVDGRLAVAVEDDCERARHTTDGEPALVGHEHAFTQFFGAGARIRRTHLTGGGTRVLLEIDHAIATRPDR